MAADLAKIAKDRKIKYFLISYVDLFGGLRAELVPAAAIGAMQRDGAGFAGFATWLDMTPAHPDLFARPDPDDLDGSVGGDRLCEVADLHARNLRDEDLAALHETDAPDDELHPLLPIDRLPEAANAGRHPARIRPGCPQVLLPPPRHGCFVDPHARRMSRDRPGRNASNYGFWERGSKKERGRK